MNDWRTRAYLQIAALELELEHLAAVIGPADTARR